jgi:osmotically-inducible protein OsmY
MEMMKAPRILLGLVLATTLTSLTSAAVDLSAQAAPRKDFQIALDILSTVLGYNQYEIFDDVTANVKDGVATLTGKVTRPYKKDEIEKRVKRVRGVTSVRNEIEVLPPSKFDEQMRIRIADAIYTNSAFWQYSTLQNPPIHILVEGSQVTLVGTVRSELDKKLAQSLAMQVGAGAITNKLLTEAEARQGLER